MSLSTQSSADGENYNNGSPGRSPKPISPKSKLENLFKADIVEITDKSVVLAKMKNTPGKPVRSYAYKVQKLKNYGRKPISPRNPKTRNAKDTEDMFDEDFPTLGNDEDLTPRNIDKQLPIEDNFENTTPNDNIENDLEGSDEFLFVWQEQDTLSMDSDLIDNEFSRSLEEYLYLENQSTVDVSFNLNAMQQEEQDNDANQDTELIRFGNKTFRSQQTSTNDLFKFRKLSVFTSTILHKCHELEQMLFNISGSSSQDIIRMGRNLAQPRLPPINEENAPEDPKMPLDYSDQKLNIYKGEGKAKPDFPHLRNANPNSMWHFILAIIGLLMLIAGIIYIHFQLRTPEPPKPFWERFLTNLLNFKYFYE